MSSERGNHARSRPQKHKNKTVFKNNLHDTSHRTKFINSIQVSEVCARCKEIIEWKIKYKKYKPLSQPKKCVKCGEKTVKKAYHVACSACSSRDRVCAKCCLSKEIVPVSVENDVAKQQEKIRMALKTFSERERRKILRYMNKIESDEAEKLEDLLKKVENLNMAKEGDDEGDEFDFDDLDDSDDEGKNEEEDEEKDEEKD